ncbi:hypothetical protein HYH03_002772 [Edaphochlamys debaryana]|uniref:Uncharacterized protein n=1 Tax=Edaphochlamys debaryana TaxID=47281 RepID=A0A835YE34_9CHLO|nr:hypothetical protein HYH03_002772 [Edaphochlamys debaryana]|eukprot:KAG2499191.1 hypothetical protein HYH03_002772 [Edaphochlamys debaryana]
MASITNKVLIIIGAVLVLIGWAVALGGVAAFNDDCNKADGDNDSDSGCAHGLRYEWYGVWFTFFLALIIIVMAVFGMVDNWTSTLQMFCAVCLAVDMFDANRWVRTDGAGGWGWGGRGRGWGNGGNPWATANGNGNGDYGDYGNNGNNGNGNGRGAGNADATTIDLGNDWTLTYTGDNGRRLLAAFARRLLQSNDWDSQADACAAGFIIACIGLMLIIIFLGMGKAGVQVNVAVQNRSKNQSKVEPAPEAQAS